MKISGAKTIAEYKEIRAKKIQKWIDSHFVEGSVKWEFDGANAIKVTDKTGDSMLVQLSEIDYTSSKNRNSVTHRQNPDTYSDAP